MNTYRMESVEAEFAEILRGSSEILFLYVKREQPADMDEETFRTLVQVSNISSQSLKAILELHNALGDLVLSRRMLKRYPWHGTEVSKFKHFELTWFLIQNLCYKFKEKLKLVFNQQKVLCACLGEDAPSWLKAELSVAEKAFGKIIRARGNTVHSWDERQVSIDWFGSVSLMRALSENDENLALPEGFYDESGHYRDTKWELQSETREMERAAIAITLRVLQFHQPTPKRLIKRSQEILDMAKAGARVYRSGRSQ